MSTTRYNLPCQTKGGTASGAALAAGKCVKITGAGGSPNPLIVIAAAASDLVYGITLGAIAQDAVGAVSVPGTIMEMTAGAGGWTAGNFLSSDASGNLIAVAANTVGVAQALETVSAAGTGMVLTLSPFWYEG